MSNEIEGDEVVLCVHDNAVAGCEKMVEGMGRAGKRLWKKGRENVCGERAGKRACRSIQARWTRRRLGPLEGSGL